MKRISLTLLLVFLSITTVSAIDNFMLEVESGVTWLHNEAYKDTNPLDKDPDPILYRVGVAFPVYFSNSFFVRPSLSVISNSWEYNTVNNWAMPVDPMWQDLMVMSILLDIEVGFQLNFKSFSLAFFAAPAFNFRVPLWGEVEAVRDDMTSYFYSEGKFFNVSAGFFFFIPISDLIGLTLKGDSWIPLYNVWSGSGLPFSDGLMVTLSAGFRFTF